MKRPWFNNNLEFSLPSGGSGDLCPGHVFERDCSDCGPFGKERCYKLELSAACVSGRGTAMYGAAQGKQWYRG